MAKKLILSSIAVIITWQVTDFVIHGVILQGTYEATASLWRPQTQMQDNMPLLFVVNIVAALMFSLIFVRMIKNISVTTGIEFGVYFGIALGIGMGLGTYAVQPIPGGLAVAWFLGALLQAVLAGALVGYIAQDRTAAVEDSAA